MKRHGILIVGLFFLALGLVRGNTIPIGLVSFDVFIPVRGCLRVTSREGLWRAECTKSSSNRPYYNSLPFAL